MKEHQLINQRSVIFVSTAGNQDIRLRIVKLRDHSIRSRITNAMIAGKQDTYCKIVLSRSIAPQESLHRLKTPGGTGSLVASEIKNE